MEGAKVRALAGALCSALAQSESTVREVSATFDAGNISGNRGRDLASRLSGAAF
jgi:hypothetical protein